MLVACEEHRFEGIRREIKRGQRRGTFNGGFLLEANSRIRQKIVWVSFPHPEESFVKVNMDELHLRDGKNLCSMGFIEIEINETTYGHGREEDGLN